MRVRIRLCTMALIYTLAVGCFYFRHMLQVCYKYAGKHLDA